jgi:XTP/dITP diphosphohydrolase
VGTLGFGYDPLFFSDDLGKSFGEATPAEKHAVSHRGRAFAAFKTGVLA